MSDNDEPTTEQSFYVMAPASEARDVAVGSVQVVADCGHACWMAPTGWKVLRDHPHLKRICLPCFAERHPIAGRLWWSVDQEIELARNIGTDPALRTYKGLGRLGGKRWVG